MKNVLLFVVVALVAFSANVKAEFPVPVPPTVSRSPGFTSPAGYSTGSSFHNPGQVIAVPRPGNWHHVQQVRPYQNHYYPGYGQAWSQYYRAYGAYLGAYNRWLATYGRGYGYGGYGGYGGGYCGGGCGPRSSFSLGIAVGGFRLGINSVRF